MKTVFSVCLFCLCLISPSPVFADRTVTFVNGTTKAGTFAWQNANSEYGPLGPLHSFEVPAGGSTVITFTFPTLVHPTDQIDVYTNMDLGATLIGNSWIGVEVAPGEPYVFPVINIGPTGGPFTFEVDDYIAPSPTDDHKKTLWLVDNEEGTLDAQIFREGIDKVVAAMPPPSSSSGFPDLPGEIELETFDVDTEDLPEQLADATDLLEAKMQALLDGEEDLVSSVPTGSPVLSFNFPGIEVMGLTTDDVEIQVDPTEYAAPIGVIRALLNSLLHIGFYFSFLALIRSAFADWHTLNYLGNSLKH